MNKENITITTMCALVNDKGQWLFIDRKKSWFGLALPGGHLEGTESANECIRREIFEETGLTLHETTFKGFAHFYNSITKERYLVFNYISKSFSGTMLPSSEEGNLLWIHPEKFCHYKFAEGMEQRFKLFTNDKPEEMFVEWTEEKGYIEVKHENLLDIQY